MPERLENEASSYTVYELLKRRQFMFSRFLKVIRESDAEITRRNPIPAKLLLSPSELARLAFARVMTGTDAIVRLGDRDCLMLST